MLSLRLVCVNALRWCDCPGLDLPGARGESRLTRPGQNSCKWADHVATCGELASTPDSLGIWGIICVPAPPHPSACCISKQDLGAYTVHTTNNDDNMPQDTIIGMILNVSLSGFYCFLFQPRVGTKEKSTNLERLDPASMYRLGLDRRPPLLPHMPRNITPLAGAFPLSLSSRECFDWRCPDACHRSFRTCAASHHMLFVGREMI